MPTLGKIWSTIHVTNKDTRAAMLFGRAFEKALAGYFRREDAAGVFFREWTECRNAELTFSGHDTWDSMLYQGFQLLDRFAQARSTRRSAA